MYTYINIYIYKYIYICTHIHNIISIYPVRIVTAEGVEDLHYSGVCDDDGVTTFHIELVFMYQRVCACLYALHMCAYAYIQRWTLE